MEFEKNSAVKLHQSFKEQMPISQLSEQQTYSLKTAYDIQHKLVNQRVAEGNPIIGVKLGFTSKAKMEQMGVNDLIIGQLTKDMFCSNGGSLDINKFIHPRVEPEVCFLLSKDIEEVLNAEEVKNYVSGVAAAIEVIDSRYANFKFSLEDVVADNCSSAAFVTGVMNTNLPDLEPTPIELHINGEVVSTGNTSDILENPWNSLAEATRLAKLHNIPLKKGMYIMAGAATAATFMKESQEISCHIEGLEPAFFRVRPIE